MEDICSKLDVPSPLKVKSKRLYGISRKWKINKIKYWWQNIFEIMGEKTKTKSQVKQIFTAMRKDSATSRHERRCQLFYHNRKKHNNS